jgi:hypothetical protein
MPEEEEGVEGIPCHYCKLPFDYHGGEGFDCCDTKFCNHCEGQHAMECAEQMQWESDLP